jgi:hypothetical protein
METLTVSVHVVQLEDVHGDVVDYNYYCSDYCARTDGDYAGWFGCVEIDAPVECAACGLSV